MAYEPKAGQFSLFKNDKGDNENRPDYRGDGLDLNGRPIEVAAWLKQGKKGKFLSCNLKLKGESQKKPGKFDDMEDDVPF
jgi:hypothetical protein